MKQGDTSVDLVENWKIIQILNKQNERKLKEVVKLLKLKDN